MTVTAILKGLEKGERTGDSKRCEKFNFCLGLRETATNFIVFNCLKGQKE